MRLAPFNTLPPRPHYIKKVLAALESMGRPARATELIDATNLTKTQVMCTLEALVKDEIVYLDRTSGKAMYSLRDVRRN